MDELESDLSNALLEITLDTETIQKLTGFYWTII